MLLNREVGYVSSLCRKLRFGREQHPSLTGAESSGMM